MSSTTHSKSEALARTNKRMAASLTENTWTAPQKLALACRILSDAGHDSGLAGQITSRGEAPGSYYTQRLGLGFDEISADNLLLVDEELDLLDGSGMPNPANRFHS